MKFALNIAPFGPLSHARKIAELAQEAEKAGWDGFFLWDHMNWEYWGPGIADPWVSLAAAAMTTNTIALGTMVTPLFRRRPSKLARETVTLQNLSGGRFILGIGLGAPDPYESTELGEVGSLKKRAALTDEGLELLTKLWSGKPLKFKGKYYKIETDGFTPTPEQAIPIWIAATWPFSTGPLARGARWQGVVPAIFEPRGLTAKELKEVHNTVSAHRVDAQPFDLVYGSYSGKDKVLDKETVAAFQEAGVTWWMEPLDPWRAPFEELRERILQGPPG